MAESIESGSVAQDVFHNLFNRVMLGSRWLKIAELETIYADANIFLSPPRVLIHAQRHSA
jgi:hypothetical protein